ncbi:GrpB family protein [Pediococcus argentinicus]|uniref:GrpB family protein n=1 Tax=Pediococcus argentinicus TaxID=480391 RepID=UPI00338DD8F6
MQKIEVVSYQEEWPKLYLKEKNNIKLFLKNDLIKMEHIGSTSVPGLAAKPIIDILLIVKDIDGLDDFSSDFNKLGYEVMGEFGIAGRRYFRKGGDFRTHQIHAFQHDDIYNIERHLSFRDFLRAHNDISKKYGDLKKHIALKLNIDIESYNDEKDSFVKEYEKKALIWYWKHRNVGGRNSNDD